MVVGKAEMTVGLMALQLAVSLVHRKVEPKVSRMVALKALKKVVVMGSAMGILKVVM